MKNNEEIELVNEEEFKDIDTKEIVDDDVEGDTNSKLVSKNSQAYGYSYTSLADIYKAGNKIPQMRIKPIEGGDYIEYLDANGEWHLGARIVVPTMKGANEAQAYGSALTYARRYTVQLALGLVSDDDQNIEKSKPVKPTYAPKQYGRGSKQYRLDFNEVRETLKNLNTLEDMTRYYNEVTNEAPMSIKQKAAIKNMFTARKKELGINE